jgi:hypothetical protein
MDDLPTSNLGASAGAEPMKKSTGRVQPKKETVRINLPPKPTAAPTIKLPTLPPGGPTGASSGIPAPRIAAAAPAAAPTRGAAPATVAPRPMPVIAVTTVSALDKMLALAAMIAALVAVGSVLYLMFGIPTGD